MLQRCAELSELQSDLPVDLEVLASTQGVRLPIEVADMAQAGCTYADGHHFRIRLRSADSPARRRFTLAHEICHTFFESTSLRGVEDDEVGRYVEQDDVEHLCDLGAAELLFPPGPFTSICPATPDFDDVIQIARRFDGSLEATASRVVGLRLGPAQLVVLEPSLRVGQERALKRAAVEPSFAGMEAPPPDPKLRVVWATGANRYVPRNKSVDDGTALSSCIRDGRVDAVEDPGITDGEVVRVVARHLPYRRAGTRIDRVMAFLYY